MAEIHKHSDEGDNLAKNQPNAQPSEAFKDAYQLPPAGKDVAQVQPTEAAKQMEAVASQPLDKIAAAGDKELAQYRPDAATSARNIEELSKRVANDPAAKEMWNHMLAECSAHFNNPMTKNMTDKAMMT